MVYFLNYFQHQNAPITDAPARPRQRRRSIPMGQAMPGIHPVPDELEITKLSGKIMKFIQKTVGSLCKLSEHPFAQQATSRIKKWGDRIAGIFTFKDILSGKIDLSGLKKVITKILSGELPSDEELGMIMSVIAFDEVIGKECDVSVQKKIFAALKISFHDHVDAYRHWMQMRTFVRANMSEVMKNLTALGMGNRFEKMIESLRVLCDSDKNCFDKEEAMLKLVEAGAGIGLFCTSLGTCGISLPTAGLVTAGLTLTSCVASALSSFWPSTLTSLEELQREIKNLIEADFKVLDKENNGQIKAGLRLSKASHFYNEQFEKFHQNIHLVCRDIAHARTSEGVVKVLNNYIAVRAELQMLQHISGEKLTERATALQAELAAEE
jgi:hypothetical protein